VFWVPIPIAIAALTAVVRGMPYRRRGRPTIALTFGGIALTLAW